MPPGNHGCAARSLDLSRPHRRQRLGAVERLDLRLFINALPRCTVERIKVEPDNVAHLVDVLRQLGNLGAMWLQAERASDGPDARRGETALSRHAAGTPMNGAGRLALQRLRDHALDFGVVDLARNTRPPRGGASRPRSIKRRRHLPAVCAVPRSRAATGLLLRPAAPRSMIGARKAKACVVMRRCV